MQATDQVATAKIAIPQANFIQKTVASVFSIKNSFTSVIITAASRIIFSSDRVSYSAKKLRQTTTLEKQHIKIAALDDKKLKIPLIRVNLEGNEEKLLNDTGASASFVAVE